MDNFEYSIQLNDREWAEFFQASEECSLAPASLATAEEQCLSDIEQGDASGRDCPRGTDGVTAAGPGGEPAAPGTAGPVPRGLPGDTAPRPPQRGHPCAPELLSGSEDEAELGSVGRFLCQHSDRPGCPAPAAMPSAQRRQPPRPPAAAPAGGTAQGGAGQDAAGGGGRGRPGRGAPRTPRAGRGCRRGTSPAGAARSSGSPCLGREKRCPLGARAAGTRGGPPEPSLGTGARVAADEEKAGTEPSSPGGSPSVVRPKVPAQPRKSRKQRGATEGDRDPAAAAAPGAAAAGKAPPGSPMSPRKGRGKDKAAKGALVRLGSEEAAENKRAPPGPGVDGGEAGTAPPKPRGKEPGPQSPGKTKATKSPKAGQAGGLGVRDSVPGEGAAATRGEASQEMPGKPLQPGSAAAFGGNAAEGAGGEPAAEMPRAVSPLCFAEGASGKPPNSLDVTWPEMYEYLFCDSQEEEELGSSLEGRKSPLLREISWPELYEYFFTEPEGSRKKGKAKDRKRKKFRGLDRPGLHKEAPSSAPDKDTVVISVPDVHERFFPEPAPNRMGWRGIFSVAPASEVKKAVGALRSLLQGQGQAGGGRAPASQALVPRRSGEELALVPLGGAQVWPEDADRALALRGAAEDPRVLSHKDMCLVFCAFASWAVKTSDLQAPDAWKTMFLASFGTLSAIRYFRRQVREGHPRT
ncbi:LOW QUALITY PROTEIN: PGC-1 and ERR-induced regulator in muscle protein 1 [Motacilla alba alba]|uniref:LOW QUALITY PROTEIN: PGC-1 and ERR-induced regulator in muscle protein 1 n=1 Tax=Motacilla alba alba TaxID=1094192 RepID=UPI0018D56ECC|nr:LOW QUALITY PROTEIN: PGC-1 and ERR-induced regulator in muscle protein 1 [Motacilla alba alba]